MAMKQKYMEGNFLSIGKQQINIWSFETITLFMSMNNKNEKVYGDFF
jgi:hypothetical protein